jgi:RNA polymerase sigma factor (sigma-70 family)
VPVNFDTLNDADFVRRVTAGDSEAFRHLFAALAGHLAQFVQRTTGLDLADAEEIAADALFKAHQARHTYRADRGAKLTTWIFEIARRCAIDHHRGSSKGRADWEGLWLEWRRMPGDDAAPSYSQVPITFLAALDKLSPSDHDLLRMRQVMEYSEIAIVERVSEQTLRVRHKRAVDRLRQIFNETAKDGTANEITDRR